MLTNWMVYVGRLTGIFPTLIFMLASRKVDTFHEINDVCHVSEQKVYCCVQCSLLKWFYNQIIRDKVAYLGLNPTLASLGAVYSPGRLYQPVSCIIIKFVCKASTR